MKALDDNENIEKEIDRMILEYTWNLFCIFKFVKELCFEKVFCLHRKEQFMFIRLPKESESS
jgi:hypothetical protein